MAEKIEQSGTVGPVHMNGQWELKVDGRNNSEQHWHKNILNKVYCSAK